MEENCVRIFCLIEELYDLKYQRAVGLDERGTQHALKEQEYIQVFAGET
jgi:hypothetical protein